MFLVIFLSDDDEIWEQETTGIAKNLYAFKIKSFGFRFSTDTCPMKYTPQKKSAPFRMDTIVVPGTAILSIAAGVFFLNWIAPTGFYSITLCLLAWTVSSIYSYTVMTIISLFPAILHTIKEEKDPLVPDSFLNEVKG